MQILLILVLTVAMYFAAAFAGELIENERIAQQAAGIHAEIVQLNAQHQQLAAKVAYASTDAFVEQEARDKLGLIKPGDVPVVVVNAPAPPAATTDAPPARPLSHWQKWVALLNGSVTP